MFVVVVDFPILILVAFVLPIVKDPELERSITGVYIAFFE